MKYILRLPVFLMLFISQTCLFASRIDSFKISETSIHLNLKNIASKKIIGNTVHEIELKKATNLIEFDLSGMTIDSIKMDQTTQLNFSRIGDRIKINLGSSLPVGYSFSLNIFYQGTPAKDPSGWGGFYFTGDYAFNLGVGFQVNPHAYGRAWFPCIDEFDVKTAYHFYVETDIGYTAACNGLLIDTAIQNGGVLWHYFEPVPMSSYLVSVAVSKYAFVKNQFQGKDANFPVWLMSASADTMKVKNSFLNLSKAILSFENAFGPQVYSKVGFTMVPFAGGAMEHAGNIAYPATFADGSLNNETLMAHELSHHWWGNNVTCKTAEDMWLNEGWASYCEHFFKEFVYSKEVYLASIAENHLNVLRYAHVKDLKPYSLINIPHEITYGAHVYKKGASVVHSLRGITGDSLFFQSCKDYQNIFYLKNASTDDMQAVFEGNSPDVAKDFFQNWVKEKGFPHVEIVKQIHSGSSPYNLKIITNQLPRFTDQLYKNLPIEVFFFKDINTFEKRTVLINSEIDSFSFSFNFKPVFVCLDYNQKLCDAITENVLITNKKATFDVAQVFGKITINNIKDSALIRLEHHWVGPDKYITESPYKSKYRYVSLDGIWNDSCKFDVELIYDGRQGSTNSNLGYLDHTLIFKTEDSLTLLYRGFPGDYWRTASDIQFTKGNLNDKQGKVLIKNAKKGDYVFAMFDKTLATQFKEIESKGNNWKIMPNPVTKNIELGFLNELIDEEQLWIKILDVNGKEIYKIKKQKNETSMTINTDEMASGNYIIVIENQRLKEYKRIVLNK